jgi:biopolymer transport protein TolR
MAFGGSERGSAVSSINVTPLVDVLLVLLIIFMITAPNVTKGPDVKLPGSRLAGPLPIDENKITVVVRKERVGQTDRAAVYFGATRLDPARMEEQIKGNEKVKQDGSVFLQADESLPYGEVQRVMSLLRQAGAERVGLVTDPME